MASRWQWAEPVFNWEMDLELFALLPIEAVGQTFDIALVDPFEAKPSYKRYAVAREEPLSIHRSGRGGHCQLGAADQV